MKSEEQIRRWIKRKSWYPSFMSNINSQPAADGKPYHWWEAGEDTINLAFSWKFTKEGFGYWLNKSLVFKIWYNDNI